MTPDYHIHTPHCGHAKGTVVEYVEAAIRHGIPEIGFADHLGRYYLSRSQRKRHWDWGMDERGLERYWNEVSDVRDAYCGRIVIKVGLEVDYVAGAEDLLEPIVRQFPFDFLLGSVHCLPVFGWQHLARLTDVAPEKMYAEYFAAARRAVESGLFDSLAHMDFIWRYVAWPAGEDEAVYARIVDVVEAAARRDSCIEANLNGFVWSVMNPKPGALDPFEVLVDALRLRNVRVSLGSDAHTPGAVGKSFPELVGYLRLRGVRHVATFDRRVRTMVEIG